MHTHNYLVLLPLCLAVHTNAQILVHTDDLGIGDPDTIPVEYTLDEGIILDCGADSTGMIPLTDLGTGFYLDYEGGLYKDGLNVPTATHISKGTKFANNLKKRDENGNIDEANGTIMMIGMGASVASDAFNTFRDTMDAQGWPGVNPCLEVKSVFIGGKDMGDILDPEEYYWERFQDRLDEKFIHPNQVQVVWMLMQSDATTMDVESYVTYVIGQYKLILADMLDEMPNLRMVYLTGMHYTGYAHESHERYDAIVEPKGYWGNLAIRELINMQMDGDPDLDFEGADRVVPYITWGPYFWADGSNARADGLTWECEEFRNDSTGGGFHLKLESQYKEADMLQDFFTTDTIAEIFFNDGPKWASCGTERSAESTLDEAELLSVSPNPFEQQFTVQIPAAMTGATTLQLVDQSGRVIYLAKPDAGMQSLITIDATHIPDGLFMIIVQNGNERYTAKVIKQS